MIPKFSLDQVLYYEARYYRVDTISVVTTSIHSQHIEYRLIGLDEPIAENNQSLRALHPVEATGKP